MSDEAVPNPGPRPRPRPRPRPEPVPGPYAEVPALTPTDTTPCWCRRRRPRLLLVREHDRERARRDHPGTHPRPAHAQEADDLLLDMLLISARRLLHARTNAEAAQASAEILTTVRDLTTRRGLPWRRVTEAAFRLRRHHGTYRQAWVIGSARTLVMPDIAHPTLQGIEHAAAVAALVLGRRDVGILDTGETRAVADLCAKVLGADLLATLTRIWTAAHQCADHDATTMLAHAQQWCDALDTAAPALPVPENLTDLLSGAVEVVMDSTAATDAADLAAHAAATNAMAAQSKAQAQDRAQRAGRRRKAAATAKSVFNARGTTVTPDGTPAPYGNPVTGTRRPTAAEQSAAARLSRALRAAAYRERTEERTTSPTPPGRLNMRAALARDAQRAAGSVPTAEPFTRTRRRNSPTPPLRVGIAVDVSGSMRAACAPVASAAWIVARAAALTDPDSLTATIAYDRHLTALTRPTHRAPERVTTFDAKGGHHNLGDAIDALDHGLELSRPGAGRLLVIVTDARYGSDETAQAVTRVKQLTTAGCAVLQLTLTAGSHHLPGTTLLHLPQPSSAPVAIATAATDAIRRTR